MDQRILGLDAWRAALLLIVIPVHASIGQEPSLIISMWDAATTTFRMAVFFILSGFFGGLSVAKIAPHEWLRRRMRQLGVPLLFGAATIIPLVAFMADVSGSPWWAAHGPSNLLLTLWHLWFLVALLVAGGTTFLLERSGALVRADRLRFSQAGLFLAAVGVALAFRLVSVALSSGVPVESVRMLTEASIRYLPFFVFGYLLARSPSLRSAALAGYRLPLIGAGALVAAYAIYYVGLGGVFVSRTYPELIVRNLIYSIAPFSVGLAILKWSMVDRKMPRIALELSRASYTMYLVQIPIIVFLNLGFERLSWNLPVEYTAVIVLAAGASYAFHKLLVEPYPVMSFLLNGKALKRATEESERLVEREAEAAHFRRRLTLGGLECARRICRYGRIMDVKSGACSDPVIPARPDVGTSRNDRRGSLSFREGEDVHADADAPLRASQIA